MVQNLDALVEEYDAEEARDPSAYCDRLLKASWSSIARSLLHKDPRLAFDAAKFVLSHLEIDKPALKKMSVEDAKKYLLDFFRRRGVT